MTTPYQLVINNAAAFIRSEENKKAIEKNNGITAFDVAKGISIGFCKNYEEVVHDIVMAKTPE